MILFLLDSLEGVSKGIQGVYVHIRGFSKQTHSHTYIQRHTHIRFRLIVCLPPVSRLSRGALPGTRVVDAFLPLLHGEESMHIQSRNTHKRGGISDFQRGGCNPWRALHFVWFKNSVVVSVVFSKQELFRNAKLLHLLT